MRSMLAVLASVLVLLAAAAAGGSPVALAQSQGVAAYVFAPDPLAASGALAPGESVKVTVTAEDAAGEPVPGATIYLWLIPAIGGGGSAAVGGTDLTASPQPFFAGGNGDIRLVYTAPNPLPAPSAHCQLTGTTTRCDPTDEIMAADAATSPGVGGSTTYTFPYAQVPAVSSDGGTLVTADGSFSASVPAGAVPAGYALQADVVPLSGGAWRGWGLPSPNLQVVEAFGLTTVPSGGTVAQSLPATVTYPARALAGPTAPHCGAAVCTWSADRLALYEEQNGAWAYLPTTVDAGAGNVQAAVSAPGRVALVLDTAVLRDVPPGFWAQAAIDRLLVAGVVQGFPDGSFRPDLPVTRAELVKMLVVALNIAPSASGSAQAGFSDVASSAWYAPYVALAAGAGIVQGLSPTSFGPNQPVTREQMAVMVARALHLTGAADLTFSDAAAIDPSAVPSIEADVAAGLITGLPDGSFQPQAPATRAQAAAVLAAAMTMAQSQG